MAACSRRGWRLSHSKAGGGTRKVFDTEGARALTGRSRLPFRCEAVGAASGAGEEAEAAVGTLAAGLRNLVAAWPDEPDSVLSSLLWLPLPLHK